MNICKHCLFELCPIQQDIAEQSDVVLGVNASTRVNDKDVLGANISTVSNGETTIDNTENNTAIIDESSTPAAPSTSHSMHSTRKVTMKKYPFATGPILNGHHKCRPKSTGKHHHPKPLTTSELTGNVKTKPLKSEFVTVTHGIRITKNSPVMG